MFGKCQWYHWTPITMRNTRKDTLAPLYRRIRGEANQLAHNTNSLQSGRLTGCRDPGEVWITFQSAANTVPCEHDFTRDCLKLGNRVVRLLSTVRARRWLGRPTLAQEPARTKPLDVGHQMEAVKTKIWTIVVALQFLRTHLGFQNASWQCQQSQRNSPGFVHLLGEVSTVSRWLCANKYVVFAWHPRQHACRCDRGRFKFVSLLLLRLQKRSATNTCLHPESGTR